jgi:ABC-type glutathione transport system ATPase component
VTEILRNLLRRKVRSTLTISGIVIGIFALTTMGALSEHFNSMLDLGVRYAGTTIPVGAPAGQQTALLPLSKADEIARVPGAAAGLADPALNVVENVMLACRYAGGGRENRRRALDLLDMVGLGDRLGHRPDQLSGGQQQRVAIARALVNRPALVFGDEPTGAVDTQTSDELNREEGVPFVIVTHDLDLAAQADRVVRLQDGRVVSDRRTAEPARPAS